MNNNVIKSTYDEFGIALVDASMISTLQSSSDQSDKRRARICMHPSSESVIHEMIITLEKDSYVKPHRHLNKTESYFVIQGEVQLIYFDEEGSIIKSYVLRSYEKGGIFYLRSSNNFWHTLVVNSNQATILEITSGPLQEEETIFASWAPDPETKEKAALYLNSLRNETKDSLNSSRKCNFG
jgi:cupin fold WbuC family metalloprotein